ncbi:MAG: twin-arginine translocase subunit TatB [Betaproteobacteria bacterium]|mgnify:CR=1 FL=1|nr:twin-arginine translocase subunit TatB [Betaproteobacteria bacterium]NBT75081.1 twin-arginine translocase subunit TatB [Betaproteobacteria bacterium]NBY13363.1 twin-arginine translocase subunit TatB [Betaproteobacteria bacterium]NCA16251.1 twin-arginine translocase subunit TatB [Betaproteobacteria bacterium]NDF04326.1 twin-arginine translocase subunit TatB [Betaproteobacteria bacterium]
MLDIGFSELLLTGAVALVVVGPKRLPVLTRTVGTLMGRAQRYVAEVKSDIQRQMELEELKKVQESVKGLGESIESSVNDVKKEVDSFSGSVSTAFTEDMSEVDVYDTRFGTYISAQPRSWMQEQADNRLRDRVKARMRRRYLTKKPRFE